jgi:hypothetical protein
MAKQRIGCLGFLFGRFPEKGSGIAIPKVMVSNRFVSEAEANFFRVLQRVVGTRGHVLAQVSLKQLLFLPGSNQSNPGRAVWQNKINQRSIDFVVCDPSTLRPLVAIELHEPSHTKPERQTRDEEVEDLLEAAGLPMCGVLSSRNYDTRELEATVGPHLPRR